MRFWPNQNCSSWFKSFIHGSSWVIALSYTDSTRKVPFISIKLRSSFFNLFDVKSKLDTFVSNMHAGIFSKRLLDKWRHRKFFRSDRVSGKSVRKLLLKLRRSKLCRRPISSGNSLKSFVSSLSSRKYTKFPIDRGKRSKAITKKTAFFVKSCLLLQFLKLNKIQMHLICSWDTTDSRATSLAEWGGFSAWKYSCRVVVSLYQWLLTFCHRNDFRRLPGDSSTCDY